MDKPAIAPSGGFLPRRVVDFYSGVDTLIFLIIDPLTERSLAGMVPLFQSDARMHLGERVTGPIAAVWYFVFVLPLFFVLKDPKPRTQMSLMQAGKLGWARLGETLGSLRHRKSFSALLISVMFYRDGISAMYAFAGIYAAGALGLSVIEIGIFGVLAVAFGAVGGLLAAHLSGRYHAKTIVRTSCIILLAACTLMVSTTKESFLFVVDVEYDWLPILVFYLLAAVGGASSNVIQAASRTLIVEQVDALEITRAFGLYAFASRATSFIGPFAIAGATEFWHSQQVGIVPVIILLGLGTLGPNWVGPTNANPQ